MGSPSGAIVHGRGTALICDASEPFVRRFPEGVDEYVVRIPPGVVVELGATIGGSTPHLVAESTRPGASASARSLERFVGEAFASGWPPETDTGTFDAQLTLRLRLLFTPGFDRSREGHRFTLTEYVHEHLFESSLSVATVAAAHGLTERHVRRVFAASGTGLAEFMLRSRLIRAHRMLTADSSDRSTIGKIAERCGFGSHAHFSRAFRAEFGTTPSEVLGTTAAP